MFMGEALPKASLADYLNDLRRRCGWSMKQLAVAADYANASSVQKYLSDPAIETLSPKAASKFAAAFIGKGKPPIQLEELAPLIGAATEGPHAIAPAALAKILGLQRAVETADNTYVNETPVGRLPVVGSAHASFWMPSAPSLDAAESWLTIPFASQGLPPDQYALRIVGPSINRTANEGHYAICKRFSDGAGDIEPGKFVHAERERSSGEAEWTIKRAKWTGQGLILCPDSDHPDHQAPLRFGNDGDIVRIRGLVVGWYKPA